MDHLGALLMAPLNIAWLIQAWALVAGAAYGVGGRPGLLAALVPALVWLVAATVAGQAVAWAVEWVRRGPHGALVVRGGGAVVVLALAVLFVTGTLAGVVDRSPTRYVAAGVVDGAVGRWGPWLFLLGVQVALIAVTGVLGARLAAGVARRPAREEVRDEAAVRAVRENPVSVLGALVRTDRLGIWRSVPMRRGLLVLAVLPGVVAVAGAMRWDMFGIFPGLVASGGALLFGVNAWCLDGRGALWRDSLPVAPRLAFVARVLVLGEILLAATVTTVLLASLRAGPPTASQASAVGCATVVVIVQVVATSLRWSVRRPYAVDLRSSRATPAPPLVMVGYSARLALSTTVTGLLFNTLADGPWSRPLLLAVPFLVWSGLRLRRTARAWAEPATRCRVVTTVAG